MQFSTKALALAATVSSVQASALLGFNYGATKSDGYTPMLQADFQQLFQKAQNLAGTSGWNAARLYTSIQSGTDYSQAFDAAVNTNTKLLLGLWGSSGATTIQNEITAINNAIAKYGSKFTDLVIGISVGSEDLYRISQIGILNKSGVGASPSDIASYISTTKKAFANGPLSGVQVGHVDTWTAWYNTSNNAVIEAADFIGVDAYPYFENTVANSIENSRSLFDTAIANVKSTTQGKPIWVTETGFPVAGPSSNLAVPSVEDAQKYWQAVGCGELFNATNTFWYTLEDNYGGSLSSAAGPIFGILDSNGNELFDLSCSGVSKTSPSSSSVSSSGSATAIGGGSPGASDVPSGVASSSGSVAPHTTMSAVTTTNSAGQTVTSSMTLVVNATGVNTGTTMAPTTTSTTGSGSGSTTTGGAVQFSASMAGLFGAIFAALVL